MARKRSKSSSPRFRLSRVGSALEDAKQVPVVLRAKMTTAIERLANEGCRAADYALSGPSPWPHLCAVHIDGWRIIVAFPAEDEVTLVKIARHDVNTDPYREIAEDLGVPISTEPRTKPPCCDPVGEPPLDPQLVAAFEAAFSSLTRRERRARSRRGQAG